MFNWLLGSSSFWGIVYWFRYKAIFTASFVHYFLDGNGVQASWMGACQDVQADYHREMAELKKQVENLRKQMKNRE